MDSKHAYQRAPQAPPDSTLSQGMHHTPIQLPPVPQATLHAAPHLNEPSFTACESAAAGLVCFLSAPFFCMNFQSITDFERGVLLRFGKRLYKDDLAGGMHYMLPCVDSMLKIDIRETIIDIPRQSVVTKEGTNLIVDGVVYYKVFDANKALMGITRVKHSIGLLAQTKLREVLALHTYNQIQMERIALANRMKAILDQASERWGVDITRVELTDLRLPQNLQMAMNAEQEAQRRAVADKVLAQSRAAIAKVDALGRKKALIIQANSVVAAKLVDAKAAAEAKAIQAQGDQEAAEDFKAAADVLSEQPESVQLQYMQTLKSMGSGNKNTFVIPFNTDTMAMSSSFFGKDNQ